MSWLRPKSDEEEISWKQKRRDQSTSLVASSANRRARWLPVADNIAYLADVEVLALDGIVTGCHT